MALPQEQFRISIEAFDGPLDLLLYLVRRAEVDIHDIPISRITEEYLEVLRQGASIDVEMAGEFLVMAATLIEIKSRSLVPPEHVQEDDDSHGDENANEDPREDLIRQLLSYQRFRTASELLETRRNVFALRNEVNIGIPKQTVKDDEPSLELLKQAVNQMHLSARGYHRILKLARTIADLGGQEKIETAHVAEALQYRTKVE